jgi:hypothetical protein
MIVNTMAATEQTHFTAVAAMRSASWRCQQPSTYNSATTPTSANTSETPAANHSCAELTGFP